MQAVPAGTTHLRGAILKIGEISAEEYAEYIIFSNEDIVVYNLYPIFNPGGSAPQWVKESIEESEKSWQERRAAGEIPEDKLRMYVPYYIELAAARSVDYVWAYYQENLPNLIVKK